MTRRFTLTLFILIALISCKPSTRPETASPVALNPDLSLGVVSPQTPSDPVVVYVQGSPHIQRAGAEVEAVEGAALREGDRVQTDAVSSMEIAFGGFATVRVLPSSDLVLQTLRSRAASAYERDAAELSLGAGAVLAKVQKLSGNDEFIVVTQNSAAGVRGTEFLVRYEGATGADAKGAGGRSALTRVAVREGRVALLPKSGLLDGLLGGREANPIAGAVVKTVFALAPSANSGEELVIGGGSGKAGAAKDAASQEAAEEAYSVLLRAAENAQAAGFDLEAAADPTAFIAAPGSDAERRLRRAFSPFSPAPLSASNAALLELLDRVRDPGASTSRLPAALPLERFQTSPSSAATGTSSALAPSYPAVLWSAPVSRGAITEPLTRLGEYLMVMGADGVVRALRQDGKSAWSTGHGVVAATALDASLALTGLDSVSVVDGSNGAELGKWSFDGWAGTPRSKAVPVPEGVAVATPRGVAVLRAENAALVREILVEGGVSAPPILAGRELVAVTGRGALAVIDLGKGSVAAEIPAGLSEPVFAPRYRDGLVCVADKNGRVVALDVASRVLRWERELGVGISAEPEMDGVRAYLWTAAKTLVTLSLTDGEASRDAAAGVESAPLLSNGRLYWGAAGGRLVVAEASSGRVLKRIEVGESQSLRPLMIGDTLYAGTAGGKVIKIDLNK